MSCKFRDSEGLRQRGVHLTCGSTKLSAVRDGDRDTRKLSDVPRGYVRGACNRFDRDREKDRDRYRERHRDKYMDKLRLFQGLCQRGL